MSDEFITKGEFIFLVALGVLLPWIIVSGFQLRLYTRTKTPAARVFASLAITLLLSSVGGVVLWVTAPVLTVYWQTAVENLPNRAANILSLVPFLPMAISSALIAPPITILFMRGRQNA
jgi:ABC-type Fe3+ transport system permease subunit